MRRNVHDENGNYKSNTCFKQATTQLSEMVEQARSVAARLGCVGF